MLAITTLAALPAGCGPTALPTAIPKPVEPIAFASLRDDNDEVYVMGADGSNPVNLTNDTADGFDPAWAPRRP